MHPGIKPHHVGLSGQRRTADWARFLPRFFFFLHFCHWLSLAYFPQFPLACLEVSGSLGQFGNLIRKSICWLCYATIKNLARYCFLKNSRLVQPPCSSIKNTIRLSHRWDHTDFHTTCESQIKVQQKTRQCCDVVCGTAGSHLWCSNSLWAYQQWQPRLFPPSNYLADWASGWRCWLLKKWP